MRPRCRESCGRRVATDVRPFVQYDPSPVLARAGQANHAVTYTHRRCWPTREAALLRPSIAVTRAHHLFSASLVPGRSREMTNAGLSRDDGQSVLVISLPSGEPPPRPNGPRACGAALPSRRPRACTIAPH